MLQHAPYLEHCVLLWGYDFLGVLSLCMHAPESESDFPILILILVVLLFFIQEPIDPRKQVVMGNQIIDARGRKFTKRLVDIRELNEQAKVIDDLK